MTTSLSAEKWLGQARVTAPPKDVVKDFKLKPFYAKYVDMMGIPVVGSPKVSDAALVEAGYIAREMLQNRPDVAKVMAKRKVRLAVMAVTEYTTDLPEHSDLDPKQWNCRARGVGATDARPASSCAEENLLGCPGDPYHAESILVHEFAHSIHLMGLRHLDKKFDKRLRAAYDAAMAAGRWKGTYAATNAEEYWAEGVQSYFGCNPQKPDDSHNEINTREELKQYDPELFRLIDDAFRSPSWTYRPPTERVSQPHLASLDRAKLPTFVPAKP